MVPRQSATPSDSSTLGALHGVPVVIKDNIATLALQTSCGSRILDGYVSPYEATAVRRLREAGAVVVAKSNMDEFAMGSSTENSAFGPTRNPHRARSRAGWIVRWFGGGGCGGHRAHLAGIGDRRIRSPAGSLLR